MKINGNINGVNSAGLAPYEAKTKKGVAKARGAAAMDTIEISAPQVLDTEKFVEQLKAQIMKDVQNGVQPHELDNLRQQVASGEYELNVADIARRILCDFD